MAQTGSHILLSRLLMLAGMVVVVSALYFAQAVLMPVALAVLVSFLLAPVVRRLERWGLWRVPSVLAVTVASFVVVLVVGYVVVLQAMDLANSLPEYKENIRQKIRSVRSGASTSLGRASETIQELSQELAASQPASQPSTQESTPAAQEMREAILPGGKAGKGSPSDPVSVRMVEPPASPLRFLRATVGPVLSPLGTAGIVVVFVIFMLLGREDLRDRLIRLMGQGQLHVTTQALDDAAGRISRYLMMQLVVNVLYGLPVAVGLYLLGVPSAFLWGLLATLLRFIPYIGPWIAASMPIALSLAVFDDWWHPMAVIGMFVVIELISNNVIEPLLYGSSTGLSPVAILVAAVFWTWLWGGVGLLLSTPLTVCLMVTGKYVPQLAFLNILLGDEPVLDPPSRFYQRLLAMDQEEAQDIAEEYLEDRTLVELYDQVILPAMHMAEQDRHGGRLDEEHTAFIHESLQEIIEALEELALSRRAEDAQAALAEGGTAPVPLGGADAGGGVLCLPARDRADEVAAAMLAQSLRQAGLSARSASVENLASEQMDLTEKWRPGVVCISALPPSAAAHARYLLKRLQQRFPEVPAVVGLWNLRGDVGRARARVSCGVNDCVVTTFGQAVERLRALVQAAGVRRG